MANADKPDIDFAMESADLYREETFTDRRIGTVRRMIPVRPDGNEDQTRPVLYTGQAQMLTPLGSLPLHFEIDASSLEEAIAGFGPAAQLAAEQAIEELKEMRRDAASSIVLPGQEGQGGHGGMPGGGNFHLP